MTHTCGQDARQLLLYSGGVTSQETETDVTYITNNNSWIKGCKNGKWIKLVQECGGFRQGG